MFKNHPKGLIPAALSNMGERFGYYIMNAVLLLFLCSKFGLDEGTSGAIYSVFYAGIYVLSLVGGFIADRTQNYKGTIQWGLVIMAIGYVLLSIPVVHSAGNHMWLLVFTCVALFLIAFGNGLFKGNLQAIVGQMYDNMEADAVAAGKSEEEIKSINRIVPPVPERRRQHGRRTDDQPHRTDGEGEPGWPGHDRHDCRLQQLS